MEWNLSLNELVHQSKSVYDTTIIHGAWHLYACNIITTGATLHNVYGPSTYILGVVVESIRAQTFHVKGRTFESQPYQTNDFTKFILLAYLAWHSSLLG